MRPTEFWACNEEDQAYMMAHLIAHAEMSMVEAYEHDEEAERLRRSKKK